MHVHDLRQRVPEEVYLAVKHDPVDQKLAEFWNNLEGSDATLPRAILRRESEGIYIFGTKKIYMKLFNDHILVRIGGGYQALDEFVKQHGEEELIKMQREEARASYQQRYQQQPAAVVCSNMARSHRGKGSLDRGSDRSSVPRGSS